MSATGRGAERRANDYYATPAWCARRLFEAVELPGGVWLDPCVGDGAILRAVDRVDVQWVVADVDPPYPRAVPGTLEIDALEANANDYGGHVDVLITNPPFGLATELISRWITSRPRIARIVICLVRLGWLASERRADLLREHLPDVYVLPNRPSFTGRGTDASDYAWAVWDACAPGGRWRVLASTPLEERRPAAAEARRVA